MNSGPTDVQSIAFLSSCRVLSETWEKGLGHCRKVSQGGPGDLCPSHCVWPISEGVGVGWLGNAVHLNTAREMAQGTSHPLSQCPLEL